MSLLSRVEKLEEIYLRTKTEPMTIEVIFVNPDIINGNSIDPEKTLIFIIN
jgi:hypothetical protein